jgi:hypothetical protein
MQVRYQTALQPAEKGRKRMEEGALVKAILRICQEIAGKGLI